MGVQESAHFAKGSIGRDRGELWWISGRLGRYRKKLYKYLWSRISTLNLKTEYDRRWGVTLPSTDMTQCCWLGNHGRLEDTKPLEEVVRWQRGDNKIYVSRVISAAPAEQHQAAPAEQQGIAAATEGIV
jgi:hypothetical protein